MRQFLLTLIDQCPFSLPFNSSSRWPGMSISSIVLAECKNVSLSRILFACAAWMPDVLPVGKNYSSPLCLKLLIILNIDHSR